MNKYQQAYDVIDTVLHLMCGEEREDGYRPTQEDMSRAMSDLKELAEKETPKEPELYTNVVYGEERNEYECPNCGSFLGFEDECKEDDYCCGYCCVCGQNLDWDELLKEEKEHD